MRLKMIAFAHTTFASLSKRNFRLYFFGLSVSLTGGWMQNVAQAWVILHLTHSGTALGIASALQCGPTLLIGPYAGVLAVRFRKRRLLMITQLAAGFLALALGVLVVTHTAQAWMVYVMAALLGTVNAIDYPVRQSFVYELAGPEDVVNAVGLANTSGNAARVVGPALAGAVIAWAGTAACFFLNAASYLAVLISLVYMRPSELHRQASPADEGGVTEGLAYAARTPVVREALLMMAVIGAITFEFGVTLPMLVKFTFGAGPAQLAYLMSAMGVGAIAGGLVTAGKRGEGLQQLTSHALAFGATTALVGFAPTLASATALMLLAGFFSSRFTGLSNGILQLAASPVMRSRVIALWSAAFVGSALLGSPLLGWLGEVAGPRWTLVAGLGGGLIAASIGWYGLRRAESRRRAESKAPRVAEQRAG